MEEEARRRVERAEGEQRRAEQELGEEREAGERVRAELARVQRRQKLMVRQSQREEEEEGGEKKGEGEGKEAGRRGEREREEELEEARAELFAEREWALELRGHVFSHSPLAWPSLCCDSLRAHLQASSKQPSSGFQYRV